MLLYADSNSHKIDDSLYSFKTAQKESRINQSTPSRKIRRLVLSHRATIAVLKLLRYQRIKPESYLRVKIA
jgi:hypothetical protein